MYLQCMYVKCITIFFSMIWITIYLLCAGNLLKRSSTFSRAPQKHLLRLDIRTDSAQVRRTENERSVERDTLLAGGTAGPWS